MQTYERFIRFHWTDRQGTARSKVFHCLHIPLALTKRAKSDLGKLDALGYYCRKKGGGGGTDFTSPDMMIGYRDIKMKGVTYSCTNIRD